MTRKNEILLIAGSDPALVKCLDDFLVDKGYTVRTVDNLRDLLVTVQQEKVNVLVMDICLAAGMGHEAISIIKGLNRHLPIIVTTEENNPALESSVRKRGIFYYHVKSFGMEELMLAIMNAMARSLV